MLYLIIENFREGNPLPVYRRFRDQGRMAPEGVRYVSSWVDDNLQICFQIMEAEDSSYIDQWIANWSDIVDFEVHAVISSDEAAKRLAARL